MGIKKIENKLEKIVEGTFARIFSSSVKPVEIGRRLVREIERNRSIAVNGEDLAPNNFEILLSQNDFDHFANAIESIRRELEETIRDYCSKEAYGFLGPVTVSLVVSDNLRSGNLRIDTQYKETQTGRPPGALVMPDGQRVTLEQTVTTIGRLQDSTVVLDDSSISRSQAEIRLDGNNYILKDLGSTNGTVVNDNSISEHILLNGDRIELGQIRIRFEAS